MEGATALQPAKSAGRMKVRIERAILLADIACLVLGNLVRAERSGDFPKALPQEESALTDFRE
jgi:hypothetical protein